MVIAEVAFAAAVVIPSREMLSVDWILSIFGLPPDFRPCPPFAHRTPNLWLCFGLITYFFFASFLATISASSSAISLSTCAPLLGSWPWSFAWKRNSVSSFLS
jgi:hypothetical protein